jgi:hypothetical protein
VLLQARADKGIVNGTRGDAGVDMPLSFRGVTALRIAGEAPLDMQPTIDGTLTTGGAAPLRQRLAWKAMGGAE